MRNWKLAGVGGLGILLAGCTSGNLLTDRYDADRAEYGLTPITPAPKAEPLPPHVRIINEDPAGMRGVVEKIAGTWTFTTPPTVTRVEKRNGDRSQISLYWGIPAADATPFVVITVAKDTPSVVQGDAEIYHVAATRSYLLNGNFAQEWTGNTRTGAAFCEMILSRPGATDISDHCHAMAMARTDEERKLALQILASITWTPAKRI